MVEEKEVLIKKYQNVITPAHMKSIGLRFSRSRIFCTVFMTRPVTRSFDVFVDLRQTFFIQENAFENVVCEMASIGLGPNVLITILERDTWILYLISCFMVTSSNGNIFRVTGPLCGEFTGPRPILRTKASDAELWCFLWSASE